MKFIVGDLIISTYETEFNKDCTYFLLLDSNNYYYSSLTNNYSGYTCADETSFSNLIEVGDELIR